MDKLFDLLNLTEGSRLKYSKSGRRLRDRFWNAGILLWWYRLWIRTDETDISLARDMRALRVMSSERKMRYIQDMDTRRHIAHDRFLRSGRESGWRLFFRDIVCHIAASAEYKAASAEVTIGDTSKELQKFEKMIGLTGETNEKKQR